MTRLIYHNKAKRNSISFTPSLKINGEGSFLWAILCIEASDVEESKIELWRANTEKHLFKQFLDHHKDGDIGFEIHLKDIWGEVLLPKKLGKF